MESIAENANKEEMPDKNLTEDNVEINKNKKNNDSKDNIEKKENDENKELKEDKESKDDKNNVKTDTENKEKILTSNQMPSKQNSLLSKENLVHLPNNQVPTQENSFFKEIGNHKSQNSFFKENGSPKSQDDSLFKDDVIKSQDQISKFDIDSPHSSKKSADMGQINGSRDSLQTKTYSPEIQQEKKEKTSIWKNVNHFYMIIS